LIELKQLKSTIESILFVIDEPVSLRKLSEVTGAGKDVVKDVLDSLGLEYENDYRGFLLREVADGYRLYTNPANASVVESFISSSDCKRLTQAALETLAIIAYKQPVTRSQISEIRGVNAEGSIATLMQRKLVEETGRSNSVGNPILYGTTKKFLESAGLKTLKGLPNLEDFAPDEQTKEQIRKSLDNKDETIPHPSSPVPSTD